MFPAIEGCIRMHQGSWGVWCFVLVMGFCQIHQSHLFGGIIDPASTHQHCPLCCLSHFARYTMTNSLLSQIGKIQTACHFHCTGLKSHQSSRLIPSKSNALNPQHSSFHSTNTTQSRTATSHTAGKSVSTIAQLAALWHHKKTLTGHSYVTVSRAHSQPAQLAQHLVLVTTLF